MHVRYRWINPLVCSVEDEGSSDVAGGGGAGVEVANQDSDAEDSGSTTESATLTEEDWKRREDAIWAESRRKYNAEKERLERELRNSKGRKKGSADTDRLEQMERELKELRFENAARGKGLNEKASKVLYAAFLHEDPADPKAWMEENFAAFAPAQPPKEQVETVTEPKAKLDINLPAGAPRKVHRVDTGELIDVFSLTPEELRSMGAQRVREEYEKVLKEAHARSGAPRVPSTTLKG